jgi:hypothetical protein
MEPSEILQGVAIAVIGSSAIWSFVQFMIDRKDKKKTTNDDLKTEIKNVADKIDAVEQKVDKNAAVLARTHILRFSDELRNGIEHSDEYFRQQLLDCDTYERFCETNPDFRNGYTEIASDHIKTTYKRLLEEHKV